MACNRSLLRGFERRKKQLGLRQEQALLRFTFSPRMNIQNSYKKFLTFLLRKRQRHVMLSLSFQKGRLIAAN